MDTASTIALAVAGLLSPVIVQVTKQYVPLAWRAVFSLCVAVLLGVVAVAITGGFHSTTVGVALAAVVGVSQTVYAAIQKIVDGTTAAAAAAQAPKVAITAAPPVVSIDDGHHTA
ncbi:MAG: hypothetical protein ABF811_00795 [Pseudoclavibacter sp.]